MMPLKLRLFGAGFALKTSWQFCNCSVFLACCPLDNFCARIEVRSGFSIIYMDRNYLSISLNARYPGCWTSFVIRILVDTLFGHGCVFFFSLGWLFGIMFRCLGRYCPVNQIAYCLCDDWEMFAWVAMSFRCISVNSNMFRGMYPEPTEKNLFIFLRLLFSRIWPISCWFHP